MLKYIAEQKKHKKLDRLSFSSLLFKIKKLITVHFVYHGW